MSTSRLHVKLKLIPQCCFWFLAVPLLIGVDGSPDAKRLYDDLLSAYNRLIRPVGNSSDRLTVKMGLKLSQLIEVVSNFLSHLS
jgi:nicotinic acetylcholine receptor